jgi:hypothetical protein
MLRDSFKTLKDLDLVSELQTEVLRHLVDGPRTVPELVSLIYGMGRQDSEFQTYYMRVKRSIRKLENKALVSTKILGRDKPYRLTRYAVENLYYVGRPHLSPEALLSRIDTAIYAATLIIGSSTLLLTWASPPAPAPTWIIVSSGAFTYLLGLATSRIMRSMRRIM